jgi:hypothetical protein
MAARRPYDTTAHRKLRAKYQRGITAGLIYCQEIVCLMPDRLIEPGQPWDLAHDDQGGYRGPAHSKCNRSEAAHRGNRRRYGGDYCPYCGRGTPPDL